MDESQKKSILEMAHGGFLECVDYEMGKVTDNILDPNTKPTDKRVLTITMELSPDELRRTVQVRFSSKVKLAPINPVQTTLFLSGNDSTGEVQFVEVPLQIPGQYSLNGEEQEPAPILRVMRFA